MNHGGRRPGAGRPPGIPNPNAGRPQEIKRLRIGQKYLAMRSTAAGQNTPSEVWEVISVSRTTIDLRTDNGDIIRLILG